MPTTTSLPPTSTMTKSQLTAPTTPRAVTTTVWPPRGCDVSSCPSDACKLEKPIMCCFNDRCQSCVNPRVGECHDCYMESREACCYGKPGSAEVGWCHLEDMAGPLA
mmetsp:Transcript_50347/g.135046  ORF Transcript_50347/g.135046 Transcript_50347/m.135046 type:complete len:107 (+) Transcript_50347:2-322(+)